MWNDLGGKWPYPQPCLIFQQMCIALEFKINHTPINDKYLISLPIQVYSQVPNDSWKTNTPDLKIAQRAIVNVEFTRSVLGMVRGSILCGSLPTIFVSSVSGSVESVILFMRCCTCLQKVSTSGHLITACSIVSRSPHLWQRGISIHPFCKAKGPWVALCEVISSFCLLAFCWTKGVE